MDVSAAAGAIKVVVVTGATGGVGRATCLSLTERGYDVIGQFASREDEADALRIRVSSVGRGIATVRADLTDPEGIAELALQTETFLGSRRNARLVGLVNNAARLMGPSFAEATLEQFDEYFVLNTRGHFFVAQALSALTRHGVNTVTPGFAYNGEQSRLPRRQLGCTRGTELTTDC